MSARPCTRPSRSRAPAAGLAVAAALALFALCPAAPAQDAALAQKTLKSAAKQAVAEMGPDLKAAVAAARKSLADFDKEVAKGNYDVGLLITLDEALIAFMGAVAHEAEQSLDKLGDGLADGLAAGGANWSGSLPDGFLPGDGSTLDNTRAAIVRKSAAAGSQVAKRLESSSRKLQKKEGLTLLARMETPPLPQDAVSDAGRGGWIAPMSVDLAVSCSGIILVAGPAIPEIGTVTVEVCNIQGALPALTEGAGIEADPLTSRYAILVTDATEGGPFAPGIYNLRASQPFGFYASAQLGVR